MSMPATSISSRLAGIVGSLNAIADPGQLSSYSIGGKTPALVVRPGSTHEVAEVVTFAASARLPTGPSGLRTKLRIGILRPRYYLALDMTRPDREIAYGP